MGPSLLTLPPELLADILNLVKRQDEAYKRRNKDSLNAGLYRRVSERYGKGMQNFSLVSKAIRVVCMPFVFKVSALKSLRFSSLFVRVLIRCLRFY